MLGRGRVISEFTATVVYRVSTRKAKDIKRNLFSKKYKRTTTLKQNEKRTERMNDSYIPGLKLLPLEDYHSMSEKLGNH